MKILLVEDDKQTADYVAKGLREQGHVVDRADNGRDGLFLASGEPYDVMIVDRHMPHMDGYDLAREIRRLEAAAGTAKPIPIIACTANAMESDARACLAAGMNDYIAKPVTLDDLRKALWRQSTQDIP